MQTSAKTVDQDTVVHIENQFYKALTNIKSEAQMKAFLTAFLSETEQTVMSKRFAILKMLDDGKSYTDIEGLLKVSSATISSISKLAQEDAIKNLLKEIAADEWADTMSTKFMEKFSFLKKKSIQPFDNVHTESFNSVQDKPGRSAQSESEATVASQSETETETDNRDDGHTINQLTRQQVPVTESTHQQLSS